MRSFWGIIDWWLEKYYHECPQKREATEIRQRTEEDMTMWPSRQMKMMWIQAIGIPGVTRNWKSKERVRPQTEAQLVLPTH